MRAFTAGLLWAGVVVEAAVIRSGSNLKPRQTVFGLPDADDVNTRAEEIAIKREGWLYGPPIAGKTSFYPTGTLGDAAAQADTEYLFSFQNNHTANVNLDVQAAGAAVAASGGIKSLDDFAKLYDGQFKRTVPNGPYQGMLSNYKDDLLFSMERLSVAAFRVVRVTADGSLPFAVDNAASISGLSLEDLRAAGRLFLVDHSDQKDLPRSSQIKYGAACQAYFFIHPQSGDFLPLAIKPNNAGSELVYTPEDEENDWTLAKLMFNLNDIWFTQWYHLAACHETAEIVYLAAIRTLSEEHPIMPILHRLMKLTWAMRPAAAQRLIFAGGPVDKLFPWAGSIAGAYTDGLYQSGEASNFQANYMMANLKARGLANSAFGPKLKSFPFLDDAGRVLGEIRAFMKSFVGSYYASPAAITGDTELQAWIAEAGPAEIKDFPAKVTSVDGVVDILTHLCYLVAVQHGVLNTNSPVASSASLPMHPLAFYAPLPTAKGVTDLMPFMPPLEAALGQIALLASFNRPQFEDTGETLTHMFNNETTMSGMNQATRDAELKFRNAMNRFSDEVSARSFDKNGLSQGMPFIWNALDPNKASFWIAI